MNYLPTLIPKLVYDAERSSGLTVSIFINILDKVPLAGAFSDVLLEEQSYYTSFMYKQYCC
jgi:hypothetical protein